MTTELEPSATGAGVIAVAAPAQSSDAARIRSAAGWACFCAGYLAGYFVTTAVPTPLIWYYPLAHRFALQVRPNGLAMDFYGRVLACLAAGGVFMVLGRAILRNAPAARLEKALRMFAVWSFVLLAFTAAMYIYLLIGRASYPAPLPPGYVPR